MDRSKDWNHYWITLILVVALIGLSGCSRYQLAYNNLDTLLLDRIDDYANLTSKQQLQMERLLDRAHRLHRQQRLPAYSQLLQQVRHDLMRSELDSETLILMFEQVEQQWAQLRADAEPLLRELFLQISPEQRKRMMVRLERDLAKRLRVYQQRSAQQQIEHRYLRYQKRLKFWIGSLTQQQQLSLRRFTEGLPDTTQAWLDYRKQWLSTFDLALQQRDWHQFEQLVLQPQRLRPPELRQQLKHSRQQWAGFLAQQLGQLQESQQQNLLEELDQLITDLDELHRQGMEP
ncbi:DUF6279 family lipoprotein [Motiliproteus coralliicola]|uniref:DUF6279 family lipoprotein n=1 Tax=Motiliproteus coralliicola TaxID=2283196 RepID=UPI001058E2E8|nr:DUF6279 family lipoprotein [Motiliproteus coralliicola]